MKYEKYERGVVATTQALHSLVRGTLVDDLAKAEESFHWLWWRITNGWVDEKVACRAELAIWDFTYFTLVNCERTFGWKRRDAD